MEFHSQIFQILKILLKPYKYLHALPLNLLSLICVHLFFSSPLSHQNIKYFLKPYHRIIRLLDYYYFLKLTVLINSYYFMINFICLMALENSRIKSYLICFIFITNYFNCIFNKRTSLITRM